jgi:hypothetical protein
MALPLILVLPEGVNSCILLYGRRSLPTYPPGVAALGGFLFHVMKGSYVRSSILPPPFYDVQVKYGIFGKQKALW